MRTICFEEVFEIKAVKDSETLTYVAKDFFGETITGVTKEAKKLVLRVWKIWKKKGNELNGKDMIIPTIVGLINKT